MVLPAIGMLIGACLVVWCWYDLARGSHPAFLRRWQWAILVLVLAPVGPLCYLLFEKLGLQQLPSTAPEELTTKFGGNLYFRGH
ncbi:MAG TPA: PLDc N-terminal domain-containing protein [Segeticoccus sp.]|jgi:hypothetical protein|nr:PLDc N-terminal domain-containing protein [Segeticoccus sp.]